MVATIGHIVSQRGEREREREEIGYTIENAKELNVDLYSKRKCDCILLYLFGSNINSISNATNTHTHTHKH